MLYYLGTDTLNRVLQGLGYEAVRINGFVAAVMVLGVVQGAYSTEVLRGAIQAIPVGQIEAAEGLWHVAPAAASGASRCPPCFPMRFRECRISGLMQDEGVRA